MMGMLDNNKKGLVSVLMNMKEDSGPKEESDSINPDQGLIDASSELLKAIEKKDASRMARCFKAIYSMCENQEDSGESED